MDKRLISFLCAASITTAVAVPAFATKAINEVKSPNRTITMTQKSTAKQYTLKINDKNVNLGKLKITKIKDQIMVPLKITSVTLGFTVNGDSKMQAFHINNGKMQANLTIGIDNYVAYSSKAIGMTAPVKLGVAPTIINGTAYVPVDFYKIILTNSNCVSKKDNVISISTDTTKTESPSINGMPNPLVKYNTLDEARKAVGFNFAVALALPEGYEMKDVMVISNKLAEVFYMKGDNRILYRTAMGNDDISGDYIVYDKVKTVTVGNIEVIAKGNGDSINLATWIKEGVSFSLSFGEAVNEKELSTIIESIK
jgi:hypothetical protein